MYLSNQEPLLFFLGLGLKEELQEILFPQDPKVLLPIPDKGCMPEIRW